MTSWRSAVRVSYIPPIIRGFIQQQFGCSVILASAIFDLFPEASIENFSGTDRVFFCDVVLPFPYQREIIPRLEERMKQLVNKKLAFETMEMTPSNGATFLEHVGNRSAAQDISGDSQLVQVVHCGRFAGRSPGELPDHSGEIRFFKLVLVQDHSSWIRIIGIASPSKEEKKEIKQLPDHLVLVEELGLLTSCGGGWIWTAKGEAFKNLLLSRWHRECPYVAWIQTPALTFKEFVHYHRAYGQTTGESLKLLLTGDGQELLDPAIGMVDLIFVPTTTVFTIISFLQSITKFLNIFSFDFEVVVVGKKTEKLREALELLQIGYRSERGAQARIEFRLQDALGRWWNGPLIQREEEGLVVSFFNSLERFVALLLEKNRSATMIADVEKLVVQHE